MQVNEEIDAGNARYTADGVSGLADGWPWPDDAPAVPLCQFHGNTGGMVVAVWMLDIGFMQFYHQTTAAVGLWNLGIGLFSGFVFGIIVALAGCMRGMQCGRVPPAVVTPPPLRWLPRSSVSSSRRE